MKTNTYEVVQAITDMRTIGLNETNSSKAVNLKTKKNSAVVEESNESQYNGEEWMRKNLVENLHQKEWK